MGSISSGIKFASIATKAVGLSLFSKDASKKYIFETLSSIPGITAKAAQLLAMKCDATDLIKPKAMPLSTVKRLIESSSPQLAREIEFIDEKAYVASLGQVHKVTLKDQRSLAVKVQFPQVKDQLSEQFELLRKSASFGPPKKYQLEIDELSRYFEDSLSLETDYLHEAKQQLEFASSISKDTPVVIPKVWTEFSTNTVLVQDFEASMPLQTVQKFWPSEARKECAEALLATFLSTSFQSGLIHSDPQPGNYGFRPCLSSKYQHELVLYDFGSTLRMDSGHQSNLYQMISSVCEGKDYNPGDHLIHLGFDADKLAYIDQKLPAIMTKILSPFSYPGAFKLEDWQLAEHFEAILGSDKWWFRTAGPAWFLMYMRAAQGIKHSLTELGVPVRFNKAFQSLTAPPVIQIPHHEQSFNTSSLSKHLMVLVTEGPKEVVRMELPARAVDELESIIPEETLSRIQQSSIDPIQLKKRAQRSGYMPQELFQTQSGNRHYKVWLA